MSPTKMIGRWLILYPRWCGAAVILFIFLMALFSLSNIGIYRSDDEIQLDEKLADIESNSGLTFPAGTQILYSVKSEREWVYVERILFSASKIEIQKEIATEIPPDTLLDMLKVRIPRYDFGEARSNHIYTNWKNSSGEWKGNWLVTTTGYYVYMQQIVGGD